MFRWYGRDQQKLSYMIIQHKSPHIYKRLRWRAAVTVMD